MNPAQYGRNGDSTLVHMRPDELRGLRQLAQAVGTDLTINPNTGYPEAWKLPSWVLPVAAIAATALTAGAAAPAAAGALGAAGSAGAAGAAGAGALGAGAAGAGAAGAGATGGLLAAEGAAAAGTGATTGGLLAGGEQAAMLAAQNAGLEGATAATNAGLLGNTAAMEQAAAPVVDMSTEASLFDKMNYKTDGLLGKATDTYTQYAKPAQAAMNAAQQGQEMAQANEPPPIQAPQRQNIPLDLSSILNQSTQWQQFDAAENERRKQLMQQYAGQIGRF